MSRPRQTKHIFISFSLLCLGLACLLTLAMFEITEDSQVKAYESFAQKQSKDLKQSKDYDWEDLKRQNPEIVGWIRIENTPIDFPVVKAAANKAKDFYLHHDFWQNPSRLGCPYLDPRCDLNSDNLLIYGHHFLNDKMFSSLADTYKKDKFTELGTGKLSLVNGKTYKLEKLVSVYVDKSNAEVQQLSFRDEAARITWLDKLTSSVDLLSTSDNHVQQIRASPRLVSLVTCNSYLPNQASRTVCIFSAKEAL